MTPDPDISWFQTPACQAFYASLPEVMTPFRYETAVSGRLRGSVTGYITREGGGLKQLFSRRAVINGGPFLSEDMTDSEVEELLRQTVRGLRRRCIYIEIRNFSDYSRRRDVFARCGFRYEPHYDFHVDTSSAGAVEANLGRSRRRDVKTSLRDGAELVESPTKEQVREFYGLLRDLYRTKVKTPLFPWSFFEKLYEHPDGRFILVRFGGRIVGGTACVCQSGRAMYEWFACGRDGVHKNIYPSTLATYGAIRYAATHGMPLFDMMGAGAPGDRGYGVRDFKAKFGGTLVEYGRFKYICSPLLYRIGCLGVKILKKL